MVKLVQIALIVIRAGGNYNIILYTIHLICIYLQSDQVIHHVYVRLNSWDSVRGCDDN
jgi:hypothetical protein